jgi:fructuronate reductase
VTRLSPATLDRLPANVARPSYDRNSLVPGILHLGSGAFHRAHLADYTEDALHVRFGPWGIVGVNLRPPDLGEMLGAQAGLYVRELRDGSSLARRMIGAVLGGMTVTDKASLGRAISLACDPAIKVVTMTVTEKGYCHVPTSGQLDADHPDIRHDLSHPNAPRSVPGFVLRVILARHAAGIAPPVFLSCDNVPENGATLRRCVLSMAEMVQPGAVGRISDQVAFPETMVDRIVPATQSRDHTAFTADTGLVDRALVTAEPFRMWVVGHDPRAVLPDWQSAGALFVANVRPYEVLKMRVVNGMQTALCHLGHLAGHELMSEVTADAAFVDFAIRLMRDEVAPHLPVITGIDNDAYIAQTLRRLQNRALFHKTAQIATDGSRKLRQRLLEPLVDAVVAGQPVPSLTLAVAGWMVHAGTFSTADEPREITDPLSQAVARITVETGNDHSAFVGRLLGLDQIFPPRIAALPGLGAQLALKVADLRAGGVQAVLADHLAEGNECHGR